MNNVTKDYLKDKKKRRAKELLCIWSVLIIPLIDLCVFWVYGTIQSFPIAFEHYNEASGKLTYDFYNFEYLFGSFGTTGKVLLESMKNTITYWALGFFVLTPVSYLMAYFLFKKIWGYKIYRYIFFFPQIISPVILSSFFLYLVGSNGIIKQAFGSDLLLLRNSDTAMPTMLFYNFYFGLCANLLYWLSAFARIPEEVLEAGKIDGCNILQEFMYIALPCTWSFFATMLMLMVTGILGTGGATLLLTGGGYGTYDLPYYEYLLTTSGAGLSSKMSQGVAGCLGLVKGLIILPIAIVINRLVNKIESVEF